MVTTRRIGKNGKTSFRFDATDMLLVKDPLIDEVVNIVKKKSENIVEYPLDKMRVDPTGLDETTGSRFSRYGFNRLCTSLDIPKRFINSLSVENAMLASKVLNDRIQSHGKGFLAAMDGNVIEGIVSDKYSRLENVKVAEMASDLIPGKFSQLHLEGLRMRLSSIDESEDRADVKTPLKVNDISHTGLDIYNGEDGGVSFNVSAYVYRLICSNGMVAPREESLGRVIHKGSGIRERAMVVLQRASDISSNYLNKFSQASEIILNNLEQRELARIIQQTLTLTLANDSLIKASEEADAEGHSEEITLYNLVNGITYQAHNVLSIDKARNIETVGARILDEGLKLVA